MRQVTVTIELDIEYRGGDAHAVDRIELGEVIEDLRKQVASFRPAEPKAYRYADAGWWTARARVLDGVKCVAGEAERVTITREPDGGVTVTSGLAKFRTRVKLIADGLAAHTQADIDKVAELGRQRDERRS